jgi:hypothetical protein
VRLHARAIVLAAGLAILAVPATVDARLRTTVTVFHAFTATGSATIAVHHASGSCFSSSETTRRSDAWRCMVANELHDPCFSSPQAPSLVICPNADPTSGLEINLTKGLPTALANGGSPSARSQPWTLELYSGAHCAFSGGASSVIHGVRLNYFCVGDSKVGLWGYPRRTTEPWTIFTARSAATRLTKRVAVKHVWT